MAEASPVLRILAHPQSELRIRYVSELDPQRNRPQRYIRATSNLRQHEYVTIEISSDWNPNKRLYIRVTMVTVPTAQAPLICVHPYPIDTPECVIKDRLMNTLFFEITKDDFAMGFKSLRIIPKKLIQHELRNYGRLRLVDDGQEDIQRVDNIRDARKIIETYQLNRCQLLFSLAELLREGELPVVYAATTIGSNIMTAISSSSASNNNEDAEVRFVPRKGSWTGGEEILMVIPKLDRRRSFQVVVEHETKETNNIPADLVDTRTISFITPACPSSPNAHGMACIPFVVYQNSQEIARIYFSYQSSQQSSSDPFDHLNDQPEMPTMETTFDENVFYDTY